MAGLFDPLVQKVLSVFGGGAQGGRTVVNGFLLFRASDGMILDAGEASLAGAGHVGLNVIIVQIESDIAVKVAIAIVARITFGFAPDLARGFQIAPKCR